MDQTDNMYLFEYSNDTGRDFDNTQCNITSVRFDTNLHKNNQEIIVFTSAVTEQEAIHAVQVFLSQPVDKEYYLKNREDSLPWSEAEHVFGCRGDLLNQFNYIVDTTFENGQLIITTDNLD
jgi:hypothetical protein